MNCFTHIIMLQVLLSKVLSGFICVSSDGCECESTNKYRKNEINYDCHLYKLMAKVNMYENNTTYIRIECKSYETLKLAQHFNQINVDKLEFENCQLSGKGIRQTISTLGINNITQLTLNSIRLNGSLDSSYLSNLENLDDLCITTTKLLLTNGSFEGTPNLQYLMLYDTDIKEIPKGVFKQLKLLKNLSLGKNKLTNIDSDLFDGIPLRYLAMNSNNLTTLNLNLQSLEVLDVSSNSFTSFKPETLHLPKLSYLDFSDNQISKLTANHALIMSHSLFKVEQIDLSNNNISCIDPGWLNFTNLQYIHLVNNKFTVLRLTDIRNINENVQTNLVLDLRYNPVESIDLTGLETFAKAKPSLKEMHNIEILLANDNFICDCRNYEFARFLHHKMAPIVYQYLFITALLTCNDDLRTEFINVNMNSFICNWNYFEDIDKTIVCTNKCDCLYRPFDKSALINCSNRNLTLAPEEIISSKSLNFMELDMSNNSITELPNYENFNIKKLNISYNSLTTIDITQLPKTLMELHLEHNNITMISAIHDVNDTLTNIRNISMIGNPWMCDCEAISTLHFVRKYSSKIFDLSEIGCPQSPTVLYTDYANSTITDKTCEKKLRSTATFRVSIFVSVLSFAVFVSSLVLLYRNDYVKNWLYSRNVTWLVSEASLDRHKKYDAFLSYSHNDEELVVQHLLPGLEGGDPPFSVCIHTRDWVPGELIFDQIARSVEESRRTIVVLSNNFLDSDWGRTEFMVAHTNALGERRSRIIVILYGNVSLKDLDVGFKTYMSTYTYIEWGDLWFWEKLRCALRDKPEKKTKSTSEIALPENV